MTQDSTSWRYSLEKAIKGYYNTPFKEFLAGGHKVADLKEDIRRELSIKISNTSQPLIKKIEQHINEVFSDYGNNKIIKDKSDKEHILARLNNKLVEYLWGPDPE